MLKWFSQRFRKLSFFQCLLIFVLLIVLLLMSSYLWHGDVLIHTDVARDLLVVQDMFSQHQLTLIGPRSSIPGVFHGPLWYYIYLIPFVLTGGNPLLMGWFWFCLVLLAAALFLYCSYLLTKRLTISLLLTIIYILLELPGAAGPTNTFFANLFAFVPFVLWWWWLQKPNWKLAGAAWLIMGLLAQFQMAFILPLALSWGIIFLWQIIKLKQWRQLWTLGFFLLPFASFVLFDLRHDFLQVNSFFDYLLTAKSDKVFYLKFIDRLKQAVFVADNLFKISHRWLVLLIWLILLFLAKRKRHLQLKKFCLMTLYWYFSWWILTLAFAGVIWNFYFDPFISILLLLIGMIASHSKFAKILLIFLTFFTLWHSHGDFSYNPDRFNSSSWKLLTHVASDALSEDKVGYFLYSQDQFAYPLKYAFAFYQKQHPNLEVFHFSKQPTTILVKSADDPNNPWSTASYWQTHRLFINLEPVMTKTYPYGYTLEKYLLDEATLQQAVDPNLVKGLEFR